MPSFDAREMCAIGGGERQLRDDAAVDDKSAVSCFAEKGLSDARIEGGVRRTYAPLFCRRADSSAVASWRRDVVASAQVN